MNHKFFVIDDYPIKTDYYILQPSLFLPALSFVDIWGTESLWTTIDRANLNFPIRPGYEYKGFIHWDYDPETKPQNVQGVLALSDQTDENMGGFQCIPWLYRNFDTWKLTQPSDRNKFQPDISGLEDKIVKVSLEAGIIAKYCAILTLSFELFGLIPWG